MFSTLLKINKLFYPRLIDLSYEVCNKRANFPVHGSGTGLWSSNTLCFLLYKKWVFFIIFITSYVYVANFQKINTYSYTMFRVRISYRAEQHNLRRTVRTPLHMPHVLQPNITERTMGYTESLSYCSGMSKWDLLAVLLLFIISVNTQARSSLHLWTWPKNFYTTFREIFCNDRVRCFI